MDNKKVEYLNRQDRKKQKEIEYDFMPGLIEIIERPVNKGGYFIIWTITGLIITALLWSYFCKTDVVIEVNGILQSNEAATPVISSDTGTIKKIYVEEGETVKENDLVMEVLNMNEEVISLRAERDGKITELSDISQGAVVTSGQTVMNIIPPETEYKIIANVKNKDIADIMVNERVNVKIEAYSYSDYGMFGGNVTSIQEYAEYVEQEGYVFPIEIQLDKTDNKDVCLREGMTANVDICIGERRIIEFVLSPMIEAFRRSARIK